MGCADRLAIQALDGDGGIAVGDGEFDVLEGPGAAADPPHGRSPAHLWLPGAGPGRYPR